MGVLKAMKRLMQTILIFSGSERPGPADLPRSRVSGRRLAHAPGWRSTWVAIALAAVVAGCSSPSSLTPEPTPDTEGPCGGQLAIFSPLANGLAPVGTDTTLDVATWNLEFFPLDLPGDYHCPHPVDVTREQQAADLVNILGLDVIAVEEISDPDGFNAFVDLCPNYDGLVSPERRGCNYQRPALIYRKDQVTINSSKLIFTDNEYAFPRSPFEVDMTIASNGRSYRLHLIVVHLKASTDAESRDRRRQATALLKGYLDDQAAQDSTANYMIAGDWNDALEDPLGTNSFPSFLGDPQDYEFLDMPMAGKAQYASIAYSGSLIDHLLVNRAACPDFMKGRVATLTLDNLVDNYRNISDHRPVMVQAPIFK